MTPTDPTDSLPADKPALLDHLRSTTRQPEQLPKRFRRLYAAIESERFDEIDLECEVVQNLLDIYVAEELEGREVRQSYPDVWQHLQTCSNCQPDYEALIDALRHVDQEIVKPVMVLPSKSTEPAPWLKRVHARMAEVVWSLELVLDSDYLREKLWPSTLQPQTRSDEASNLSNDRRLLLMERAPLGDQQVIVEVKASQIIADDDRLTLYLEVTASSSLPAHLVSQVSIAGQLHTAPFNADGHAVIEGISLAELRETLRSYQHSFKIVIEVRAADDASAVR